MLSSEVEDSAPITGHDPSQGSREDSCNISARSDMSMNRQQNVASSMMHYQALVADGYISKVDRMKS